MSIYSYIIYIRSPHLSLHPLPITLYCYHLDSFLNLALRMSMWMFLQWYETFLPLQLPTVLVSGQISCQTTISNFLSFERQNAPFSVTSPDVPPTQFENLWYLWCECFLRQKHWIWRGGGNAVFKRQWEGATSKMFKTAAKQLCFCYFLENKTWRRHFQWNIRPAALKVSQLMNISN